jgi:hypothetical protein
MRRADVAFVLAMAIVTPVPADVVPPAVRCQAAKIWVAGRYVARHPRCRTRACAADWTARLTRSFETLERDGDCLTHGDATQVEAIVRDFETKLAAMLRRRDRPCARLFVAATARMAGVEVRLLRPRWPPQRESSKERSDAWDRFDDDRIAAKVLHGCRSVILGSKLMGPAGTASFRLINALLPPEVATGLRVELPPGWRLHDVLPGHAVFVNFDDEYGHGGIMPEGGADLRVDVRNVSVDEWSRGAMGEVEPVERLTIDGRKAFRATSSFDSDQQGSLDLLIPGGPFSIELSFGYYTVDEARHRDVFERMIRTARFFPIRGD